MQKRTKESKKRLNSLILLIAFTAILLIISTYAWFTTQKNVQLSGLSGYVNVAEGMEISLSAEPDEWSTSIDLSKADLIGESRKAGAENPFGSDNVKYAAPTTNNNFIPSKTYKMMPVSTIGDTNGSTGKDFVVMAKGTVDGNELNDVTKYTSEATADFLGTGDDADHTSNGYYAFDVYVKNTSADSSKYHNVLDDQEVTDESEITDWSTVYLGEGHTLQLTDASSVDFIGNSDTATDYGIQNAVRVGFALAKGTVDASISSQSDIVTKTDTMISQVAIWEPNANAHVQKIVDSQTPVSGLSAEVLDENGKFGNSSQFFTFGLNSVGFGDGTNTDKDHIRNIYNWSTTGVEYFDETAETPVPKLAKQNTVQTPSNGVSFTNLTDVKGDTFSIGKNRISKLRIYIWLEGQDVDCVNYASYAEGINVNIGIGRDNTVTP